MANDRFWAVVPAAGKGTRMGAAVPKQYLTLNGQPVLLRTLSRLLDHPRIEGLVLALSKDDEIWSTLNFTHPKPLHITAGGHERCHSVLNALEVLEKLGAANTDWVLVHDAARPCVRQGDISRLIAQSTQDCGGLLGVPVSDTLKRCDASARVEITVDRTALWRALTPQMFRLNELRGSLRLLAQRGILVTDDAAAMEAMGHRPRMVEGHADNIKITRPEDLRLAALYLEMQEGEMCG